MDTFYPYAAWKIVQFCEDQRFLIASGVSRLGEPGEHRQRIYGARELFDAQYRSQLPVRFP